MRAVSDGWRQPTARGVEDGGQLLQVRAQDQRPSFRHYRQELCVISLTNRFHHIFLRCLSIAPAEAAL
jgi:hypothetical protein